MFSHSKSSVLRTFEIEGHRYHIVGHISKPNIVEIDSTDAKLHFDRMDQLGRDLRFRVIIETKKFIFQFANGTSITGTHSGSTGVLDGEASWERA